MLQDFKSDHFTTLRSKGLNVGQNDPKSAAKTNITESYLAPSLELLPCIPFDYFSCFALFSFAEILLKYFFFEKVSKSQSFIWNIVSDSLTH